MKYGRVSKHIFDEGLSLVFTMIFWIGFRRTCRRYEVDCIQIHWKVSSGNSTSCAHRCLWPGNVGT